MTALLYHSRMTGRTGRALRAKRFGGVALAAVMVLAQPVFAPLASAQDRGVAASSKSNSSTGAGGGRGEGGGFAPAFQGFAPSEGSDPAGIDGGFAGNSASSSVGEAYGEGYGDAAGDVVGSMLDAPDGAEGVIKAPQGGSGYRMTSDYEAQAQGYETLPQGNSFLPAADHGAGPVAAEAMPEGRAMDDPAAAAPDAAASARAVPAMSARVSRRDLGTLAHSPVVVELFTSQGCSACPPADEMLAGLADRPDVLALSWHVDYWDYLGWADEFAKPEFTQRQKHYARAAGERSIYTPQILIGGTDTLFELRPADLVAVIDNQLARPVSLSVTAQDLGNAYQIELTPRAQMKRGVAILLVRYAPVRQVEVRSGENRGMILAYRNIVLGVDQIASWDGKVPLRLKVSDATALGASYPADTRHAILAQQVGRKGAPSGAILAAVKLD